MLFSSKNKIYSINSSNHHLPQSSLLLIHGAKIKRISSSFWENTFACLNIIMVGKLDIIMVK